jgi:hypothetical protein
MLLMDPDHKPLAHFRTVDLGDPASAGSLAIARGLPRGAHGIDPAELFLD